MNDSIYLKFEDLSRPVQFSDCQGLIEKLPLIFANWKITQHSTTDQAPVITVSRDRNGDYTVIAELLEKENKYQDEVDTLCALVARVIKARTMEDMNLLCLHGAAVEIGGALLIFPNKYRAGKSVLSVCMAASGHRLYTDDVLPVSLATGEGIAPGLAPRLRFPYPDNLNDETHQFIESRVALRGKRYHYLDLRRDMLAARNSRSPIGAFVFLDRIEGAKPELLPIAEAEVLRRVVWQNFAREVDAPSILGRLGQLVGNAQRYNMRYDRADDAVELLAETFCEQNLADLITPQNEIKMRDAQSVVIDIPAGYLLRKNGISEIKTDDNAFLADASGAAIHHLNPVGSAIWNLLARPITLEQIIELLVTAFPDAETEQVERDVKKLIKALKSKNLLLDGPRRVGIRGSG